MITAEEFESEINRCLVEFPGMVMTPVRADMVWNSARTMPKSAMVGAVNNLIRSMRKPPVVQDFLEALASERRSIEVAPFQPTVPVYECGKCLDLGIVNATAPELELLAKCDCDAGKKDLSSLPTTTKLGPRFKVTPIDPALFRPVENGSVMGAALKKAAWWKEQIRASELKYYEYLDQQN